MDSREEDQIVIFIQAVNPLLHPHRGETPSTAQASMLYIGLYSMTFGAGGFMACLPAHGADQFNGSKTEVISSYFNWFFFSLCAGGMLAVTFLVWIQENKGWIWTFGCTMIASSFVVVVFSSRFSFYKHKIPSGSPLTRSIGFY